jgi:hypothetical protein
MLPSGAYEGMRSIASHTLVCEGLNFGLPRSGSSKCNYVTQSFVLQNLSKVTKRSLVTKVLQAPLVKLYSKESIFY